MERLEIFEVQAAKISLEIADKSLKRAYALVEDVLVKVEDLYIPADFIILDTGEDDDKSTILGRPFLAIANAIIDVAKGELVLQLWEDHILFKMPKPNSFPKGETTVQYLVFQPSLSVQSYIEPPDTKSKFGVVKLSTSTEDEGTKKKVSTPTVPPAEVGPPASDPDCQILNRDDGTVDVVPLQARPPSPQTDAVKKSSDL
nr:uncharacterized protein LOC112748193 [Arachis hypogaea]